jgi:hypothetical protein
VVQRTKPYRLPLDVVVAGRWGTRLTTVTLAESVQAFTLPSSGRAAAVRLDPAHRLLLWEPDFGPVPGVTPSWTRSRTRAWLSRELTWLAYRLGVGATSVVVVDGYRVAWLAAAGVDTSGGRRRVVTSRTPFALGTVAARLFTGARTWASAAEAGRALAGMLRRTSLDTVPVRAASWSTEPAPHAMLVIGHPRTGQGVVVLADEPRIGLTFATEVAQRVAVVFRWPTIPRVE